MPTSRTTASQNHATSATDRATSSSGVSIPWERMKRVTLARSTYSSVGDQMMSVTPPTIRVPDRSIGGADAESGSSDMPS
jgi:hypothetical protein